MKGTRGCRKFGKAGSKQHINRKLSRPNLSLFSFSSMASPYGISDPTLYNALSVLSFHGNDGRREEAA